MNLGYPGSISPDQRNVVGPTVFPVKTVTEEAPAAAPSTTAFQAAFDITKAEAEAEAEAGAEGVDSGAFKFLRGTGKT